MALIFCDSFDHYSNSYIQSKWTQVYSFGSSLQGLQLNTVQARTGPQCGAFTGPGAYKTIKNSNFWTVGGAFNWAQYGGGVALNAIGTTQVSWTIQNDGTLAVYNGPYGYNPGGLLGTTDPSTAILLGRYYYIEMQAVINQSSGSVIMRINGQVVLSVSGNTSPTGFNYADVVNVYGPGGGAFVYVDDLYVTDNSGTANQSFLGDVEIGLIMPASAGDYTQWTPVPGPNNYAMVNNVPPQGDTSYVWSVAPASGPYPLDTYFFQTVESGLVILAIQTNIIARKNDVGNRALSLVTRYGGANNVADPSGRYVNETYIDYLNQQDVNPLTTSQWTPATLNAAQFGYQLIT
jgi:hypothetical protein